MTANAARRTPGGRLAVVLPLLLALGLASRTVSRESCTVDEFGNLPLTIAFWTAEGRHIDPGNPPLTRWIQGLPFALDRPDLGASLAGLERIETSWDLGYRFEKAHAHDYHELLVRARRGSVALLLLTVLGVWLWARDLAGPLPALGASLLAAASPNLLAHGRLVTPDVGIACFVVGAGWAAHRAVRSGARRWTVAAGLLTGAACLTKFSALLLGPGLGLALALGAGSAAERGRRVVLFGATALAVLYAAYGLAPPGALRGVPTPLPAPYVHGIEAQLAEEPYPAYLLGEVREGGWRWYYVVAFLVKVPLPAIALFAIATGLVIRRRRTEYALPLLLAAGFFVAFSLATDKNIGLRYVLPVLPLLHVTTAAVLSDPGGKVRRAGGVLVAAAVLLGVAASRAPIASFNGVEKLLGGKRAVLVDSNLDWGQALPDLREWMEREEIEAVQLAYFGRIDPSRYGISWRTLPSKPVRGSCAISATLAVGRPYAVLRKERPFLEPELAWSRPDAWAWLRDREPDAELGGGSILVWKDVSKPVRGTRAEEEDR